MLPTRPARAAALPVARPAAALPAVALLLAALLAGCTSPGPAAPSPSVPPSPSSTPAAAGTGELDWQACESGFECATLTAALGTDGSTLELAVTRSRATGPGSRLGSLVVDPGGPGVGAVDWLHRSTGSVPAEVRARFDLVAFDPRGVGRSSPVRCGSTQDVDRYFALDPRPDDPAELTSLEQGTAAFVAGCAARSGSLLPYVSTAAAAEDLDRLRSALGDERLTYLGYSYGTAIGAAYLDAYPERVRAMVLDGALDPTLSWDALLTGQSKGFDEALGDLLADCERTRCPLRRAVTGDLGAAFDAIVAKVDSAPLPAGGGRTLGPGELSLGVGAGLYDRQSGWPAVAAGLVAANRGDGRALLALSDDYLQRSASGYSPLAESNLAVTCIDRPWPRDASEYTALAARVEQSAPRFGGAIVLAALPCATWPAGPVSTPHPVRAEGAPKIVVIGTTRDPATPYAWAVGLAGQLSSGVLLTHDGDGHTVYGTGAPDCIRGPVDDYLVDLTAPQPATC